MNDIDMSNLSVAALRALVTIHETGSLSRAAEKLGVTQSTLSHTLGRLRKAFNDALFLRQGRGVVPTARCDMIVGNVETILAQLAALAEPPVFEPASTEQAFTLSCNFYERMVLVPDLLRRMRSQAPKARLKVIQSNLRGHEQLHNGLCDLLLSPVPSDTAGLYRRKLLDDHYSCFLDRAHARRVGPLTLETYKAGRHIAVNYDGGWKPFYRSALDALGVSIVPHVELPSFGAVGEMIEGSEFILTAPSALAPILLQKAAMVAPPFDASFEVFMFWNARQHASPASIWLRGLVVESAGAIRANAG